MDGQGPEHSSARIERFLQLLNDDPRVIPEVSGIVNRNIQNSNFQVCNPTSSANYFHMLKRQMNRNFRKPLVVSSPKKLLRLKQACSELSEFSENMKFSQIRTESHSKVLNNQSGVKKLLICSGQVYFDLVERRDKLNRYVNFIIIIYLGRCHHCYGTNRSVPLS
jgi:2-oxoglutarate dehydrogenase E1 component